MKKYEPLESKPKHDSDEKDVCVSCGVETPYSITTNINQRQHYVEGAGQLCGECYKKIYN